MKSFDRNLSTHPPYSAKCNLIYATLTFEHKVNPTEGVKTHEKFGAAAGTHSSHQQTKSSRSTENLKPKLKLFLNHKGTQVFLTKSQWNYQLSVAPRRWLRPPWGRPGPCCPPPGCSSPGRGYWDSTSATAALLLTACMTDIFSDKLGHMTFCMGKMNFSLVKKII